MWHLPLQQTRLLAHLYADSYTPPFTADMLACTHTYADSYTPNTAHCTLLLSSSGDCRGGQAEHSHPPDLYSQLHIDYPAFSTPACQHLYIYRATLDILIRSGPACFNTPWTAPGCRLTWKRSETKDIHHRIVHIESHTLSCSRTTHLHTCKNNDFFCLNVLRYNSSPELDLHFVVIYLLSLDWVIFNIL